MTQFDKNDSPHMGNFKVSFNILSLTGYYLPAYKAGGPVKTISNMVENLHGFNFFIVTQDRDLGDANPFQDIKANKWQKRGRANVMYLSKGNISFFNLVKVLRESEFDVLYLNSYFDFHFSIKILLAIKLGFIKNCPIVLAPRGEFSKGALAIKSFKKAIYIKMASLLRLYKGVIWQASSEYEKHDIINSQQVSADLVCIAKNLPAKLVSFENFAEYKPSAVLKMVFLSRISTIKNLDFTIRVLSLVKYQVFFDIYGPQEDETYWKSCLELISSLPNNISVNYCGFVNPEQVGGIFSKYDLFFFPTRGENYGHVIAESLLAGTSVLISDQTPWKELEKDCLGWDLPLESTRLFAEKIESLARMSPDERLSRRRDTQLNGSRRVISDEDIENNKRLFEFAFKKNKQNKA